MDNFNIHKFLKGQYLAESFTKLNENSLTNDEMQKESDLHKLRMAIELGLGIDINDRLGSGTYNGRDGYYLKVIGKNPQYWEDDQVQKIKKSFKVANNQTEKYDFEYEGVSDYETDDDRYWPASISLFAVEKDISENSPSKELKSYDMSKHTHSKSKQSLPPKPKTIDLDKHMPVKETELPGEKVTKDMWEKMSDDEKEDALLSVFKDSDDALKHIDKNWNELPGDKDYMVIIDELKNTNEMMDKKTIPTSPGKSERGDDGKMHNIKMSNSERKTALRNVLDVLGKHYPELTVDDKLEFLTAHSKDFFNGNVDPYDEGAIKDEYEEYFTFNIEDDYKI